MIDVYENLPARQNQITAKASVLIAFYNNLDFLKMTLAGFANQSETNFEIVICDDGSKPEVVSELKKFLDSYQIPTRHLWHEDKAWRKNRMLNWGIHWSRSTYLIFIDQDCVPHPKFVEEHIAHSGRNAVLCGRRMDLTPWLTRRLTTEKISAGWLAKNLWWIVPTGSYMKDNNGPKGIYLRSSSLRNWLNRKYRGIVGCNFSIDKENILKINGFDTRYNGPGSGEDSDIEFRLSLLGLQMTSFAFAAVQYHLWHRLLTRPNENEKLFQQVKQQARSKTEYGLSQQLSEICV